MTAETERHRQAAYLYSIIQSAEEGIDSDGPAETDVEKAYDAGILFAARMLLDNAAGANDWTRDATEYADEIRRRVVPGHLAFNDDATRAEAYGQGRDDEAAGLPLRYPSTP